MGLDGKPQEASMSRELDALVARHVFGHDVRYWEAYQGNERPSYWDETDGCAVPAYSYDIAAAWQVVEKLAPSEPWAGVHFNLYRCAHGYQATFEGGADGEEWKAEECADTAPLAICLAALKAKGVEGA
jgi:hypothetical protein